MSTGQGEFIVEGGHRLKGEITPQGAKNEALQILCAVLLTEEKVTIHNIPNIIDVMKLIDILKDFGVKVKKIGEGSFEFIAKDVNIDHLQTEEYSQKASKLRGSIMVLGPLLARFGKGKIPKPGGDKIGRRRLDTHFLGFKTLGAKFDYTKDGFFKIDATDLHGSYILLDEPSVTGTANVIMAAVMAKGKTTLYNAACEPYIQQLCKMLNRMGANITGHGSNLLTIEGVERLGGTTHTMLPDMIEIGSFIGLAAMTQSEITIKNCRIDELGQIPTVFKRLGIQMEFRGDDIFIPAQDSYQLDRFIDGSILTVADGPWPLFTPDLLSIVLVTAIQAKGTVLVHQKMFESRLFFVDKLIDMGAQIILNDPHRATVIGMNRQSNLKGIRMSSPDIRAGVALLIAALSAEGTSVISNIDQIDRGYQDIEGRLKALGAKIERR
ncbi:UDP-N-acetylglucosamine 1-carboxyvinyltransferase [Flammeovirga yaeyamensis]|uniref:UDP-N-acetylglucosamine 1-carboxyvinyltransferase n=1 Tax=Flammeovirga yaeyamensis TaxID=367791 RepID=A0AAX1NAY7_9BACT|nr:MULTISPECIES: UDP-N-acetylglucosamine 1-carboxyvinyltransferase [Flammeovirga]ANQ49719.1 UDP-N-acetylglucosamine 1-carboxyvinyltransferase [Flammeovirga sp. MY04]MBB3697416.1 UDP-N-acetylglucosamine 1-carboxyvinyltransferase [Flammeovirga yaeyamensis]NMF36110.1 UDP-N-acetylglucosamine 1-carboxyvinyltransferase [Flammeovirga yaeyamensis]QWG02843.1 UDP-N-acetylglucosamine 1-carboxyvinyltransferase [Flammeovirga yaeyamensis]